MCYTTTHYSSPPPPPSPPLLHSISSPLHHQHHHPPQTHLHAPPQNHDNSHPPPQSHPHAPPQNHHNSHPPPQIHKKHQLFQKYQQQDVSSLIDRIAALESSLRRRKQSPRSSSLRDAAARTIQSHFRAFLVRRSVTLRHLKDLACIKSALNKLKSYVSDKIHFDSYIINRESMNLLIKLDSIEGSDPMIRDGKRSISRELIRFMELIDEISTESQVISVKNVRFSKNGKKSVISASRVFCHDERKFAKNLKNQIKKTRVPSVPGSEEEEQQQQEVEQLEVKNPRKPGVSQIRIGDFIKSQRVVKSQPKVKKTVSFDENENVCRLIKRNHSPVSSDASDSSNGDDEEVEEIGVASKETEDSSEMSGNEVDPRKNLRTRIDHTTKQNQPDQEDNENDDDNDDDEDSFVFSAPLPAKMEYRVDSVNKKQTAKH